MFYPLLAFAQENEGQILSVKTLMFRISYYIINPIIILLFVVALLYFIWGLIEFLRNRQFSADKSNVGKTHMLYGVLGMTIMVSAFAIMAVMANIIGADSNITAHLP